MAWLRMLNRIVSNEPSEANLRRAARAAAYGVTGDLALAEDAASEAFCAALENLHDLRDPSRFGPWLHTVVVRVARRLKRAEAAQGKARRDESLSAPTPSAQAERRELAGMIREADRRPCIGDVVDLFWNRADGIELRAVEELLKHLVATVAPNVSSRVLSHGHPHYRSALLLQFGDILIPAALGGVFHRRPAMPDGIGSAHVRLHIESWATARTGQVFEPEDLTTLLDRFCKDTSPDG